MAATICGPKERAGFIEADIFALDFSILPREDGGNSRGEDVRRVGHADGERGHGIVLHVDGSHQDDSHQHEGCCYLGQESLKRPFFQKWRTNLVHFGRARHRRSSLDLLIHAVL